MSLKTTTASGFYITPNGQTAQNATTAGTTTTFAYTSRGDVFTGTPSTANAIQPSIHVTNPGVFTFGTAPEGTLSKTTNDSNPQ